VIKDENYINIQGWMLSKLGLKGNQLLIYAIIYGFCQDGESTFHGSLSYFEHWTNSTRQGVIKALKQLQKDGLIIKIEGKPNNAYYINVNKINFNSEQSLPENDNECKQSSPNNIDNSINNKIDNKYTKEKELQEKVDLIIKYFNERCNTKFRSSSNGTKRIIKSRLNEGAKLHDFYDVIDFKWKEWGEHPTRFSTGQLSNIYLRPSTLFGPKMEEYLQQAWLVQSSEGYVPEVKSVDKLEERSDLSF
jgi:uncharacterized phage protein (TIGR02220 family)